MNRYKSSTKVKPQQSATIIFQDDFEQPKEQQPTINNLRYKSIPSQAALILGDQMIQQQQNNSKLFLKPLDELKMTNTESSDNIKVNNFFGDKKMIQRKTQMIPEQQLNPEKKTQKLQRKTQMIPEQQLNPEKKPQKLPVDDQDPHLKLAKLVQKQIQDRQKWQKMAELKQKQLQQNSSQSINQQTSSNQENPLLVINNADSLKKASSKQKLQKLTTQKFSALNLQKNNLLYNKGEQQEYQHPQAPEKQDEAESPEKKKRTVTQLRPLKKKPSTFEVLNQLDMVRKKDSANTDTESPKKSMVKKRVTAKDIHDFEAFNRQELGRGMYLEGSLERNRTGVCNLLWPEFRMVFDNKSIIYSKKTMKGYDIMLDPQHPEFLEKKKLATVQGNFVGSYYNIYEGEEEKQILATIYYNPDSKSVTRQVELYVKRSDLKYWDCDRDNDSDNAFYSLKSLYLQGDNRCDGKIKKYVSKQPYFDQKTKSYKLDFGGKATVLSIKNVILVEAQNTRQKVFVFGKCGDNSFNFRAETPLSPVVIMGYLMTSFNFKFATQ